MSNPIKLFSSSVRYSIWFSAGAITWVIPLTDWFFWSKYFTNSMTLSDASETDSNLGTLYSEVTISTIFLNLSSNGSKLSKSEGTLCLDLSSKNPLDRYFNSLAASSRYKISWELWFVFLRLDVSDSVCFTI